MTRWVRPDALQAGNGVLRLELDRGVCRTLFGQEAFDRWAGGGRRKGGTSSDRGGPKLALDNYDQRPIPGQLTHHADIIESGESVRFEIQVAWPSHFPDPDVMETPPLVTPGKFGLTALLRCRWRFERVPGLLGRMLRSAPHGPPPPASTTGGASAPADADSHGMPAPGPATAPTASPSAGAPGPAGPVGGAAVATQSTELAEVFHGFRLAPGETQATFRVTCEARFDEYFEPTTFTRDVVVMSSAGAMAKLQGEAFADLGGADVERPGSSRRAPVRPRFRPSPAAGAGGAVDDPMARDRATQREQLEAVAEYLRGQPSSAAAVAALDAELERQDRTERLLDADRTRGWQAFQLRGTYLSRTEGIASGPLDLHGTARTRREFRRSRGDQLAFDTIAVQLRDLSRRFEQTDFTFEATGATFDEALRRAFDDLALTYPRGLVSIEAEQLRGEALRQPGGMPGRQAAEGHSTGQLLGFQRSTETTWKGVREKVWDPVAQVAVNLGAIALMALVPGSATIVAPALIAYNSTPAVDNVRTHGRRGTLTVGELALSTGEIALNVLPMVSRARPFTAGWFAVETANWGGQTVLMGASAVGTARDLQARKVEALAREYQQFLELQKHSLPSDPGLAAAEAALRRRAADVDGEIERQLRSMIALNLVQIVAGSVIHNSSSHARAAIVEHLGRRPSAPGATATGTPADPTGAPSTGHGPGDAPPADGCLPTTPPEPAAPATTARDADARPPGRSDDAPGSDARPTRPPAVADPTSTPGPSRVEHPKPGLFEAIQPWDDPPGWTIVDDPIRAKSDGTRVLTTRVEVNGKRGFIERAYNPQSEILEMHNAFLDEVPRWIDHSRPLVDGKGTPTVTYLTIRQMKILMVPFGAVTKVKMSTIQNLKAIIQLHVRRMRGEDPNVGVLRTHSVHYAETSLVQSGHRVVSAEVTGNIWKDRPLGMLMEHYERGDPDAAQRHDQLIQDFGEGLVTRDTHVWMNYDILLKTAPFSGEPAPDSSGRGS